MGFWSNLFDSATSIVSSVWDGVKTAASTVWEGVKNVARGAVTWLAEKAENFVAKIPEMWETVKNFITPVLKVLKLIPWPPLQIFIRKVEAVIKFIDKAVNSTLAKKITKAIKWISEIAKKINGTVLAPTEREEVEEHGRALKEAEVYVEGENLQSIQMASISTQFVLLRSEINDFFEDKIILDFEQYLRLRATQKLLDIVSNKLSANIDISEIGSSDLLLLKLGREFLKPNPVISNDDLDMLNGFIKKRYGKDLIPFVFEEMVAVWVKTLEDKISLLDRLNSNISKITIDKRNLENTIELTNQKSSEQDEELKILNNKLASMKIDQSGLRNKIGQMKIYIYASEGLLQVLEDNEEIKSKDHLYPKISAVGRIIIDCAQNNKPWEDLTEEEKELVIDFANIYAKASNERVKLLTVAGAV